MADGSQNNEQPIIIKKIKKGGHGHHGGAWKVAYADFVTAMMAFFIVMWILAASEETKEQVTAYFDDPGAFSFINGRMAVPVDLGLKNVPGKKQGKNVGDGSGRSYVKDATDQDIDDYYASQPIENLKEAAIADSVKASKRVKEIGNELMEYLAEMKTASPELSDALESTKITFADDGLRIDLIETDDNTFFKVGSSTLRPEVIDIMSIIGFEIGKLPNNVSIEGHTDSRGFNRGDGFTNWELSADRANSARRVMERAGLWEGQVVKVIGYADSQLFNPDNPFDNSNRRTSILINYLTSEQMLNQRIDSKQQEQ